MKNHNFLTMPILMKRKFRCDIIWLMIYVIYSGLLMWRIYIYKFRLSGVENWVRSVDWFKLIMLYNVLNVHKFRGNEEAEKSQFFFQWRRVGRFNNKSNRFFSLKNKPLKIDCVISFRLFLSLTFDISEIIFWRLGCWARKLSNYRDDDPNWSLE